MLRVISGTAKGKKLKTLDGLDTRPTLDRVKESLFNIIAKEIWGSNILDLYCGNGNLGIEALSRGAKFCKFIDKNKEATSIVRQNLVNTGLIDKAEIITSNVINILSSLEIINFDIIFLDPPYGHNLEDITLQILDKADLKENILIIVRHEKPDSKTWELDNINIIETRKYGKSVLTFLRLAKDTI